LVALSASKSTRSSGADTVISSAETCRNHQIAATLYYRWKDEAEKASLAALGGRSAATRPDLEQEKRIKQLERALGRSHLQIEILSIWRVSKNG